MTPPNTTGAQALSDEQIKAAISEAIGFDWKQGELQPVNAHDLFNIANAVIALSSREQAGAVAVVPRGVYGPNDGRPGELYGNADWIAQNHAAVLQFLELALAAPGAAIAAREQESSVADELLAFVKKIANGEVKDHMFTSLEDEASSLWFRSSAQLALARKS